MKQASCLVIMLAIVAAVGWTSSRRSETRWIGRWQSQPNPYGNAEQFEFLPDGSVIHNFRRPNQSREQQGTGTFKFIAPAHVKVELQPSWDFGVSIYEVVWQDNDHVGASFR